MAALPPASSPFAGARLAAHAESEWVLANGLGGFAMGCAGGTPRRRYHALLVAALSPPVGRVCALQAVAESLVVETGSGVERQNVSNFAFAGWPGRFAPEPLEFTRRGDECAWTFAPAGPGSPARVSKTVRLADGANAAEVSYVVRPGPARAWLELRPLVALRDFHALLREHDNPARFRVGTGADGGATVTAHGMTLHLLAGDGAPFTPEPHWWRNFEYARDLARGQDGVEDLFCPGVFLAPCPARRATTIPLLAWLGDRPPEQDLGASRRAARVRAGADRAASHMQPASRPGPSIAALASAADQFVVRRLRPGRALAEIGAPDATLTSIIAGYPWFGDWGRDTFIALPGLLLSTGRFAEALGVLDAFAEKASGGLIPNCFDDASGDALYNTADASLWYVIAACDYLRRSGDRAGFMRVAAGACLAIIDAYTRGTGTIRLDSDGLIAAGDPTTQLTWMDAKRDGVVFTPRHGKPVEINALWHAALNLLADAITPQVPERAADLRGLARRAGAAFAAQFWNESGGCLHDVLAPSAGGGFTPVAGVRPNQVFALSLPHCPLSPTQQRRTLGVVRERLLTPRGLRTLDPSHPDYQPRFEGPLFERDRAYHNGTVWPWLIGPYAEAVLRVGGFSPAARVEARAAIEPLVRELIDPAPGSPIGTIAEVYDADETPDRPRRAEGCPAQAWSVAELLRVLILANTADDRE